MPESPPRPDANRLALGAIRSILDAAHPFTFEVEGRSVHVAVEPEAQPAWPRLLSGLQEDRDAPWPRAVRVSFDWGTGRATVQVLARFWGPTDAKYPDFVGIKVSAISSGAEVLWFTVTNCLANAPDGTEPAIRAMAWVYNRPGKNEDLPALTRRLRRLVQELNPGSKAAIPLFQVRVPSGEVLPSPGEAFEKIVRLALLRLPFQLRDGREGIEGEPPMDIGALAGGGEKEPRTDSEKRAALWPLPGGVRAYGQTLVAILQSLEEGPMDDAAFASLLEQRFGVKGTLSPQSYRQVVTGTGLAFRQEGALDLTTEGSAFLANPTNEAIFEALHRNFTGMLDSLCLADAGPMDTRRAYESLRDLLGMDWKDPYQTTVRRNWLLSLGLTDRTPDGDVITDAGRNVLARHDVDAVPIRARLGGTKESAGETEDEQTDSSTETEEVKEILVRDRLVLRPEHVEPHLKDLRFPPNLVAQACAALTTGRHLLLVGPPGTGKTKLSVALSAAAKSEGYIRGLHPVTASADWTTFETIGGYMIQASGAMEFRPGAFLLALKGDCWLLVDELNRADVDRAFGEMMTVLAGENVETALQEKGRNVSIGYRADCAYRVSPTFRLLATMNTWDKTSLFRLSYAMQRRFAILYVGLPEEKVYAGLIREEAAKPRWDLPALDPEAVERIVTLFSPKGLLAVRPLGPAIARDALEYVRVRAAGGTGLAEAVAMGVLAQLEGLDERGATDAWRAIRQALEGWATQEDVDALKERYREAFPHVRLGGE